MFKENGQEMSRVEDLTKLNERLKGYNAEFSKINEELKCLLAELKAATTDSNLNNNTPHEDVPTIGDVAEENESS